MPQSPSGPRSALVNAFTIITPIKQGFIPEFPAMRYAERVRHLLGGLGEPREGDSTSVLDLLRSVHFAQWSLIDHDERLLFNSFYVGPLELYLRDFSTRAAAVLDLVWQHCDGYPGAANFDEFCDWVEAHRVGPVFAYAANPDLTVLDIDWLRGFHRLHQGMLRDVQDRPEEIPARLAQLERDARLVLVRDDLEKRLLHVLDGLRGCEPLFGSDGTRDVLVRLWRGFLGPDAELPPGLRLQAEPLESEAAAMPVAAE
jgi:hypothetical protein